MNILDVAVEIGATAVVDLIEKAGLSRTLRELQDFTMFIPTNEAIEVKKHTHTYTHTHTSHYIEHYHIFCLVGKQCHET